MNDADADLRAFYDQEAALRAARVEDPLRAQLRADFVELLLGESRASVVEVGTGPGRDLAGFRDAGFRTAGVDLSPEHVRLSRAEGLDVVEASLFELPYADATFDAGWTMSTLVHIPDDRFHEAMRSIVHVLRPGSPLGIGMWGGFDHEGVSGFDTIAPPRFFSLRTHERTRAMLAEHGAVERFDTWEREGTNWEYQFAVVRVP